MAIRKTKTTYLQMLEPPEVVLAPPRGGVDVRQLAQPGVEEYRHLYGSVGADHVWVDRLRMPPAELQTIIQDPLVEIYVLHVEGRPAGYSELDRRQQDEIEIAYFGLFPEAIGQGLGKYFLNWTVHTGWSHRPQRLWLHTCDLDHPAALPNYLKAGFVRYDERLIDQWVPDGSR